MYNTTVLKTPKAVELLNNANRRRWPIAADKLPPERKNLDDDIISPVTYFEYCRDTYYEFITAANSFATLTVV